LGNVSTFLKILKSANNSGLKAKSERSDQLILKGPTIFESEYIYCFSKVDGSVWIDLTFFSVSIFFNSFLSSRPRVIVRETFLDYNFFVFKDELSFYQKNSIFFGSSKFGLYFGMLNSNFAKLKDRQISDVVIRLIVANIFKIAVRIRGIKKIDKSFVFIIMTRGYFCWILKN